MFNASVDEVKNLLVRNYFPWKTVATKFKYLLPNFHLFFMHSINKLPFLQASSGERIEFEESFLTCKGKFERLCHLVFEIFSWRNLSGKALLQRAYMKRFPFLLASNEAESCINQLFSVIRYSSKWWDFQRFILQRSGIPASINCKINFCNEFFINCFRIWRLQSLINENFIVIISTCKILGCSRFIMLILCN